MILTVTVHSHCAPQAVAYADGVATVAPGESLTAEFDEAQEALIRASSGHFAVRETAEPANAANAAEPAKPRRGRPPRHAAMGE